MSEAACERGADFELNAAASMSVAFRLCLVQMVRGEAEHNLMSVLTLHPMRRSNAENYVFFALTFARFTLGFGSASSTSGMADTGSILESTS